ncbi:long-chain fatty acid--CoA ligase [bacterium]|nr:long-chain fatty acid--CoA ligase [bacterium]
MASTTEKTIIDVFWRRVESNSERPAILHKVQGIYQPIIWREHGRVIELAMGGLAKLGISREAHLAILSQPSPKWSWADLAILSLGGVSIPIYPTLNAPEVDFLIKHSDAVAIFVENDLQLRKILDRPALPEKLKFAVIFEGEAPPSTDKLKILKWDELLKDGEIYLLSHKNLVQDSIAAVTPDMVASIVYTSGTTGIPKGVMLSHDNIYSVCAAIGERMSFSENDLALSFLPLSHVYERVGGQFLSIFGGITMAFAESIEAVPRNMVETHPTIINGVPRFYEKAYQRIQSEVKNLPKTQQILINWAFNLNKRPPDQTTAATESMSTRSQPNNIEVKNAITKQLHAAELRAADRLVFSKIRRRFGGRLRMLMSGAAPLPPEVQRFFDTIGLNVLEGYGLTETSAPLACNNLESNRPGTVGRPLDGVEVKLAEDGELLVRGPNVFKQYYKNPEATAEAFADGWFKTGDIAGIDSDGFITIKDRKKDIIITAGGKHVAPQYIENLFKGEAIVSHCLVYGDRRKFITCLLTLNREMLKTVANRHKLSYKEVDELYHHPLIKDEVDAAVGRINQSLATFERIKRYEVLTNDFTVEDEELTPTFKVKRKHVTAKYQGVLDSMYPEEDIELEKI